MESDRAEQGNNRPNNVPPVEHRWKPGQSGNPSGRPKGSTIVGRLRKILEQDDGKVADALVEAALKAAKKGDFRFFKEIIDRMDGPIRQQLDARIQRIVVEWDEPEEQTADDRDE